MIIELAILSSLDEQRADWARVLQRAAASVRRNRLRWFLCVEAAR